MIVTPHQVGKWKKQLLEQLPLLFSDGRNKKDAEKQRTEAELYQQIGQMKVELDWLKKKVGLFS